MFQKTKHDTTFSWKLYIKFKCKDRVFFNLNCMMFINRFRDIGFENQSGQVEEIKRTLDCDVCLINYSDHCQKI